jgi:hypothetical protein
MLSNQEFSALAKGLNLSDDAQTAIAQVDAPIHAPRRHWSLERQRTLSEPVIAENLKASHFTLPGHNN